MYWIIEEFAKLSLGDSRLNKRAQKVLARLNHNPTDSIPVACNGAAETKATYRFFDNEQVTAEKIQQAHLEASLARMAEHPVVLIPQDTTVLNFSKQYKCQDAGSTTKIRVLKFICILQLQSLLIKFAWVYHQLNNGIAKF